MPATRRQTGAMFPGLDRLRAEPVRVGGALAHVARFPQRVLISLVLAAATFLALVAGLLDVTQPWETDDLAVLRNVREGIIIPAGVFLFGAGVLQLSTGRIDADPGRVRLGGGLAVFGLVLPVAIGLGGLVHETATARMLSPVLVTAAAAVTLALLTTTGPGAEGFWSRPGALITLCALALVTMSLAMTAFIAQWRLDPPLWAHVSLDLAVAAGWLVAAATAHRRQQRTPSASAGVDPRILVALGAVWLLRAMAAYDVEGWGVSPALLLLAVAVVVATQAMAQFVAAAEGEHRRVEAAELAAQEALEQLAAGREQRRELRHGVRNSLYALRIAAEALADHGEKLDADARQRLQRAIRDETAALGRLVESEEWSREHSDPAETTGPTGARP
jgi:hypothetical protein